MSDISIDIPFYLLLPLFGCIYWPVTLGLAVVLGWAAFKLRGPARMIAGGASLLLLADLVAGWILLAVS
ncbi:hypothetical protein [Burkholderia sp. 22PA0106]|uniref:hypothetical protein n=1 Tax=Burkholderia sp. 22PA0106 TaxID=3237371 RepID=UPI0039C4D0D6